MTQFPCESAVARVENKVMIHDLPLLEPRESTETLAAVMSMASGDYDDGVPEDDTSDAEDYWSEDECQIIKAYYENEEDDDDDDTLLVLNDQAQIMLSSYARGSTKSASIALNHFTSVQPLEDSI